jgi:RecJ-like exonuclease
MTDSGPVAPETPEQADESGPQPVRRRGWLGRLRRLVTDAEQLDAEDLQEEADRSGAKPVAKCAHGQPVTVTGRLRSVVYTPKETVPTVDAELFDGSGSVHLVWLGRRRIFGIEPGRMVTARGRVAEHGGRLVIFNPWYELRPVGA